MRTNDIRHAFLTYFKDHDHAIVDSSPLVPHNDSTLLFTNSGMVQFKNIFTGQEATSIPRATTAQKCVRAGGKHNDLENVGHTARHHTFFEMLGNFSFGDYFKERAVELAWNLITKEFGLDKNRLLVTIYHDDEDAAKFWRKVAGLDDKRIIRIATSDNFWSMGETGPCGPCSEIFYDHGEGVAGGPPGSADADGDRFIEIWNLVFMQYEQRDAQTRVDLPHPSIDTGMGLERIAAILQGVTDNYDIDLMQHLIEAVADASNTKAGGDHSIAQRVIADHLRSACFLIADGVLPSNEGRGYVLRRIMRRAMRHAHQMRCKQPLLYQLVPALITQMGGHYTELKRGEALMREILKLEEERFKETLGRGLAILNETMQDGADAKTKTKQTLDGSIAFKLYDTYGFPLDLTEDVLRQHGWQVDVAGFETAMAKQKQAARKAWAGSGDHDLTAEMQFLHNVAGNVADNFGTSEFLGYETLEASGQILVLIKDGAEVKTLTPEKAKTEKKPSIYLIANQTPFYAESGGQEGDHGVLTDEAGAILARITNTFKTGGVFFHAAELELETGAKANLSVGDSVRFVVDRQRRQSLRCNHSVTHLLHAALRQHLGTHVTQKGSLVAEGRLRFDFSHPKAVTGDELTAIEETVNTRLRLNTAVTTRIMTEKAAVAEGALALFGEKYGDEVRVVAMGGDADAGEISGETPGKTSGEKAGEKKIWSVELCGGTHVARTGEIGVFKIIAEGAVASGVRRIEGVSGEGALGWINKRLAILGEASGVLKTTAENFGERLGVLVEERRTATETIADLRHKLAMAGDKMLSKKDESKKIGEIVFVPHVLRDTPAKDLKVIADKIAAELDAPGLVVVVGTDEGKASLVVAKAKK